MTAKPLRPKIDDVDPAVVNGRFGLLPGEERVTWIFGSEESAEARGISS